MKAGIAIAMLATRALLEAGPSTRSPHRHALDDGRRDRQRVVARGDRGRGAPQPRGSGAGAVAARRRGEDVAQGLRPVPASRPRRRGARRHRPVRRARARFTSWRTRSVACIACRTNGAGCRSTSGTVSGGTRANVIAEEARAVIDVRAQTRNEAMMFDSRRSPSDAERSADAPRGRPAGSTARRWNAPSSWSVCTSRQGTSRGNSGMTWPKAAPAAVRTGISPPRSGFQLSTGSAPLAMAPTPFTNT